MGIEMSATETILVIAAIALSGSLVVSSYAPVSDYVNAVHDEGERETRQHLTAIEIVMDPINPPNNPLEVLVLNVGSQTLVPTETGVILDGVLHGDVSFDVLGTTTETEWVTGQVLKITLNGMNAADGTHRVRVVESYGADDTLSFELGVAINRNPTAAFTWNSPSNKNLDVDASTSSDPDSDPLTYEWDYGDGSPIEYGVTQNHRYQTPGSYTVTLTVDDGNGGTDQTSQVVTV